MRNLLAAALLLALVFTLSGCTAPLTTNTEDLLVAPRLNQRQTDVYRALEAIKDVNSLQFRYPQSGEHRSPFIFYDLDGDDNDEAILFYATNQDEDTVRMMILQMDETGAWHSVWDRPGKGKQVEFIQFSNLLDEDWECLVIGWGNSTLGVYSYVDGRLRPELEEPYHRYSIDRYLGDSLEQLALVSLDPASYRYRLALYGQTGGVLGSFGDIFLAQDINSVLQMRCGLLWDGGRAVYVDERRIDLDIATEIVQVEAQGLTMIVGESADQDNYRQTRRSEELLCEDLFGDGHVDIPTQAELPWVLEGGELPPPPLIQYIRIQRDESFVYAARAVRNEAGYLFFFPDQWLDDGGMATVTVLRRPESLEWRFYKVDPDFDTATVELLRIQVYSTRDYRDQFIDGFLLAEKGLNEYYAYIPPGSAADEPLAVSPEQVMECFLLL